MGLRNLLGEGENSPLQTTQATLTLSKERATTDVIAFTNLLEQAKSLPVAS